MYATSSPATTASTTSTGDDRVDALAGAGLDPDRLGPADLFAARPAARGRPAATKHALDRLDVGPGTRLLDVGSGIGGTSRMAAMAGAEVTGIDLSPDFVDTATSSPSWSAWPTGHAS